MFYVKAYPEFGLFKGSTDGSVNSGWMGNPLEPDRRCVIHVYKEAVIQPRSYTHFDCLAHHYTLYSTLAL